ncbi:hypothetical protein ACNQ1O_03180 [Mycoplasma sp. B6188]|uniref:hypothetical protein n=1 Tax=Mycoplasma sp. B6188 TaxID=3401673 RepID=UPI003AAF6635
METKNKIFKLYIVPICFPAISGFCLNVALSILTMYHFNKSNSILNWIITFAAISGFFLLFHLINWALNHKEILRIDSINYSYTKQDQIIKHPFWLCIWQVFSFIYSIGKLGGRPTFDQDPETIYNLDKWKSIDTSQLENYLNYKDQANCKKLFVLAAFMPFFIGFAHAFFVTMSIFLVANHNIYHYPTWSIVLICIVCFLMPFISGMLIRYMRSIMAQVYLNRVVDMTHDEKLNYFVLTHSDSGAIQEYLDTISSDQFLIYISSGHINYS